MSKLDKLIAEFGQDGVGYVAIGEIAECYAGATPKTEVIAYWENGTIPWMSSGEVNNGVIYNTEKKITQLGYDNSSTKIVPPNTVVVALAGQGKTRGTVAITRIELCTNQSLCSIVVNDSVNSDFLYYYLQTQYQQLRAVSSGDGTRGGLNLQMIKAYKVPVPPFAVQSEIVRILDNFKDRTAELIVELTAELTARKKQYEYYRDSLLNFGKWGGVNRNDALCDAIGFEGDARWVTLGEIATDMYRGAGIRRDQITESGTPCVRYGEIYTSYNVWFDKCVSHTKESGKSFGYGDILFAITGESVEEISKSCVYVGDEKCLAGGDIVVMKHKQNPKYLAYALSTFDAQMQKSRGRIKSKVVHSSIPALKTIRVPIPSLDMQARIVAILDRFDALTTDIIDGLPAEILARHKQYEYYRDKLLTFKEKIA